MPGTVPTRTELAAERELIARADALTLGPVIATVDRPVRCFRCVGRVYRYASTPDGARSYCSTCARAVR